jgi:hypothetical protein
MAISKIVQNSLSDEINLSVKVATINIANSSYSILDDTAVNVGGGYIVITGDGFESGAQVIVGSNTACSVSFVSSTQLRAQVPAQPAGTYNVFVANSDGGTGLKVNGLTYSATPTWVTASALANQTSNIAFTGNFNATSAVLYQLQTGSSFPTGFTLANTANGFFTGNVNVGSDTTFNFTVEAIDAENQESPRAFSLIVLRQPYVTSNLWFDFDAAEYNGVLSDGGTISNGASVTNRSTVSGTATATNGGTTTFRTANGGYFEYGGSNYFRVTSHTNSEALNRAKSISVLAWMQSNGGGRQCVISRYATGFDQFNHLVDPTGDYHYNSSGAIALANGDLNTNSWSNNTWFLTAWVYNVSDGIARWYQNNGTQITTANFGTDSGNGLAKDSAFTDNHTVGIGTRGDVFESLTGRIAIARIYTKALTQAEIQQEYASYASRFGL